MLVPAIVFVLIMLIVFLLLNPFELHVNTWTGVVYLRWRGIVSARLAGEVEDPALRLWVMGWRKEIRFLEMGGGSEEKEKSRKKDRKKAKRKRAGWFTWSLALRLLRTFRVKTFDLLLDTDDYVMNAFLFPVFSRFSGRSRQLKINFSGRNELVLIVTNRIWDLVWAFIIEMRKSKF
jgi:hypothetical protein